MYEIIQLMQSRFLIPVHSIRYGINSHANVFQLCLEKFCFHLCDCGVLIHTKTVSRIWFIWFVLGLLQFANVHVVHHQQRNWIVW